MKALTPLIAPFALLWSGILHRLVSTTETFIRQPRPTARKNHKEGHIALVGAGPGARDLLTLRALQRMQQADVVFYDRLIEPEVLELIGSNVEKVFVGKHVGAHSWPQEKICRAIVAEALKGRRVVRLKSGDPGIFGRAGEELDAARSAGIPVELVPGITAASASAAALGRPLTERGETNTLILSTGTGRCEDPTPDCTRLTGPGSTTALYMSVRQADRVAQALRNRGLPGDSVIEIAVEVEKPGQRLLSATVDTLADCLANHMVNGCAILLITWKAPAPQMAHEKQVLTKVAQVV